MSVQSVSAAFELPRPETVNPIFRTLLRPIFIRERKPEPLPVAGARLHDPLEPSRIACQQLARRYCSFADASLPEILSEARHIFCAPLEARSPMNTGTTIATILRRASGPGIHSPDQRTRIDAMAFWMLRLEREHGAVEPWRLYEVGFSRQETIDLGFEAAQLAECITRIIQSGDPVA